MAKRGVPPRQDLSGHISLDVPLMKFIEASNHKAHKVATLRKAGLLSDERGRNPILAEKSPRLNHRGFDFHPPAKQQCDERWTYPEGDWGLMAKFRSQKDIYDEIFKREREYKTRMAELHRIRDENQLKIDRELERQQRVLAKERDLRERAEKARMDIAMHYTGDTSREDDELPLDSQRELHHHHHHGHHGHHSHRNSVSLAAPSTADELDQSLAADRAAAAQFNEQKRIKKENYKKMLLNNFSAGVGDVSLHRKVPKDISEMKISEIRDLNAVQPQVLQKWRAQRAAEFVSTKKNALEVPAAVPSDTLHSSSFRPGGVRSAAAVEAAAAVAQNRRKNRGNNSSNSSSSALVSAGTETVRAELRKTEAEIARTELRLKLNAKPQRSLGKTT